MTAAVTHRLEAQRFETAVDRHGGFLDYRVQGGVLTLLHTEVDPALQGRGLAGALVRAAPDHARSNGLTVDPECP